METGMQSNIEIRLLDASLEKSLVSLFSDLKKEGVIKYFRPHPLTEEEARKKCNYNGKDAYYVCLQRGKAIAYCMLRGWDQGNDIPRLGVAVHPDFRGKGLGELCVRFLHIAARLKGASKVSLTVHHENTKAIKLYSKLGYTLKQGEPEQLIGTVTL